MGMHNRVGVGHGKPFVIVDRHWTCDWNLSLGPDVEVEYGVSFYYMGLLNNAAIIGTLALAGWFLWRRIRPAGPTWSKVACWVYTLSALSLLAINVWFAFAHQVYGLDLWSVEKGGPYALGWPLPIWKGMLGSIMHADTYNVLILFIIPLLLAIVSEKIARRRKMKHNNQMHQMPDGAGDP